MRKDSGHPEGAPVLASSAGGSPVLAPGAAAVAQTDGAVALPRLGLLRLPSGLRWPEVELGPRAGRIALATIGVCALAMMLFATHGPTILVPRASQIFASWEAGPLYHLIPGFSVSARATNYALSGLILILLASYIVALGALRTLSMRRIAACIVAVHAMLLLAPRF